MSGEIQLSKYHDAEITILKCSDLEKGLELSFKLVNSVESTLSFSDCQFYRVDGMWKQNVVYRIRTTSTESMSRNEVLEALGNMVRNDDHASSLPARQIELWLAGIVSGDLVLSMVEPSTGAEFTIVSKSIKEVVSRGQEPQ